MVVKKKVFPKFKKKIKWFLTDESGKITKKDALGLAASAMLLASIDETSADTCNHSNSYWATGHASWYESWWHANWYWPWTNINASKIWTAISGIETTHASWVVNWHYSATPNGWAYDWFLEWNHANWMERNWWSINWQITGSVIEWNTGAGHMNGYRAHCSCSRWM